LKKVLRVVEIASLGAHSQSTAQKERGE
jgi:hypothetical protein